MKFFQNYLLYIIYALIFKFTNSSKRDLRNLQYVNVGGNDNRSISSYLSISSLSWYNKSPVPIEKNVNFNLYTINNSLSTFGFLFNQNEIYITLMENSPQYSLLIANLTSIKEDNRIINTYVNFSYPINWVFPYTSNSYGQSTMTTLFNVSGFSNPVYNPPYDVECTMYYYDLYYYPFQSNSIYLRNITNYKSFSVGIDYKNDLYILELNNMNLTQTNFFTKFNDKNFSSITNGTRKDFQSVKIKKNFILLQSYQNIYLFFINDPNKDFYSHRFTIQFNATNTFQIPNGSAYVYDFDIFNNILFLATSSGLQFFINNNNFMSGPYLSQGYFQNVSFNKSNNIINFVPNKLYIQKNTLVALMPYQGLKILDLSYINVNKTGFNSSYLNAVISTTSEFFHPYVFTMDEFANDFTGQRFVGLAIDQTLNFAKVPEFFIELLLEGNGKISIFKIFNSGPSPITYDNIRSDDWYTYLLDKTSLSVFMIKRGRLPNLPNKIYKLPVNVPDTYRVNFNTNELTKLYLVFENQSGNYSVVFTNSNITTVLSYIYEIQADLDCMINEPGNYNLAFSGMAEVCSKDTKDVFYDVNNYCAINSLIKVNASIGDNSNTSTFYFPNNKNNNTGLLILVSIIGIIILISILIIIFKFKCFCHLCRKEKKPEDYEKTNNNFEMQVDQK